MSRVVPLAALLAPVACQSQHRASAPVFAHALSARTLAGGGGVPSLPAYDRAPNLVVTTEIGHHPLQDRDEGGAALGTGLSLSSVTDLAGRWAVLVGGPFAKVDLTYLFLTGLWAYPVARFPVRVQLGGRLGVSISQSSFPQEGVAPPYTLVRPELQSFFDVEAPLGLDRDRTWSVVGRVALDTGVNLSTVFRYSFSAGLDYGWDP